MAKEGARHWRILLCGLEPSLAEELSAAIRKCNVDAEVQFCPQTSGALRARPDLIFCSLKRPLPHCDEAPRAPVIVVSRTPEAREWIEAMEAGAADYCAAPFEAHQIRWILDTNRGPLSAAARV